MSKKKRSVAAYAKALFDVALTEQRPEAVGRELAAVAATIAANPEATPFLGHPSVPVGRKKELIDLIALDAEASGPLRKLLALMGDRGRLGLVAQLNLAYQARLLQHLGIVEAHVTTAVALDPSRAAALASGLQRATGKKVRLTTTVNPSILGGVIAQIGSRVFDGSVARQVERLREQLASGA